MQTSTRFNTDSLALTSDFDAMALTEFDAKRTEFEWPLEATRDGFFEAETKADDPVFKQARLRKAPELFGGRGLYQVFRNGKRVYVGESKDLKTRLQEHRRCPIHMGLTLAELDHSERSCHSASHRCSDIHGVIDVAPSSIADDAAFRHALDAVLKNRTIDKYIPPPTDPGFHFEIILKRTANELMSRILRSTPLPMDVSCRLFRWLEMD